MLLHFCSNMHLSKLENSLLIEDIMGVIKIGEVQPHLGFIVGNLYFEIDQSTNYHFDRILLRFIFI